MTAHGMSVLKALRSRTRSLQLDNSELQALPPEVGQLDFLSALSAKNNQLQTLPPEIARLKKVFLHAMLLKRSIH